MCLGLVSYSANLNEQLSWQYISLVCDCEKAPRSGIGWENSESKRVGNSSALIPTLGVRLHLKYVLSSPSWPIYYPTLQALCLPSCIRSYKDIIQITQNRTGCYKMLKRNLVLIYWNNVIIICMTTRRLGGTKLSHACVMICSCRSLKKVSRRHCYYKR